MNKRHGRKALENAFSWLYSGVSESPSPPSLQSLFGTSGRILPFSYSIRSCHYRNARVRCVQILFFLFFLFYPPKNIFRHLATMPYTPLHTKCRKDKQHQKVQSIKYFSLSRIRVTHAPVPLLERWLEANRLISITRWKKTININSACFY